MDAQPLGASGISHEIHRFTALGVIPRDDRDDLEYPVNDQTPQDQLVKLGKTIRAARKASGLSLEDLAYEAEIDYSTMGEIERGQRNATLVKLMRIATALNRSMAELFTIAGI